ncbi:MAG: CehA/McbA family metallohydrolase, partial [Planctomycetes bacterium]|nr:CehA/McbA family metallohydrolase [Planctomycetota bacterium]
MRIVTGVCVIALMGLFLAAAQKQADKDGGETCKVTLRLTDARTGGELAGLIRVTDGNGKKVPLAELFSRGRGLKQQEAISQWSVLTKTMTVQLPRKKLTIHAFSGLETETASVSVDLSNKTKATITIPLTRFYSASDKGLRSANTHLHLQKISRKDCDRYLREIPKADGLDMVFVSYLERAVADREYTSNRYRKSDLAALTKSSGVRFGNGEEHRHNFTGFGQGYGHVMFLNIKKLIQPVSIGPGIMKLGTDGIPLRRGIAAARRDGAAVIWCHNNWGTEAVPNFLLNQIDAQNIFDGGAHGSYKDSFYRYLNIGLKVPFSTGTDWFMYDFSRVYCDMRGDLTIRSWLETLAAGRSYLTNGPLLEFRIDGKRLGETVALRKPGNVPVRARVICRNDFLRLEVVQNGRVVANVKSRKVGGHYEAEFSADINVSEPSWFTLRTPPPPVKNDAALKEPVGKNEFGRDLFAHSSAIFVTVAGKSRFDKRVARQMIAEMRINRDASAKRG